MTTLIVVSSILVYIFIGLVVGKVWYYKAKKNCCAGTRWSCSRDHESPAALAGLFWPIGPPLVLICIALGRSSDKIAERLTKGD